MSGYFPLRQASCLPHSYESQHKTTTSTEKKTSVPMSHLYHAGGRRGE